MSAVQAPVRPAGVPGAATAGIPGVPLTRLTVVELRKLADTRSGMWLLIVIGLAAAATVAILLGAAPDEEQTFRGFFAFAQLPAGVLLPVLGILSMTGEWSQRTALTTFTLEPRRGRVVAAKLIAATVIAVLAWASCFGFAAAGNLAAQGLGGDGSWTIGWQLILQCLVLQVLFVLMGAGFGALLMNPPLAIVAYFALPMVWTVLAELIRSLRTAAGWLDINLTTTPLAEGPMTGDQWARLGVSAAVWVLVPLVAGTVRVLRREVS
jgi:ABC-type transport system involved in multi-copper enzyme maturation permease subunit